MALQTLYTEVEEIPYQKDKSPTNSIQSGSINFVNTKKAIINFITPFSKKPKVLLTMGDTSVSNPYVTNVNLNNFIINLQNNYTGLVEWLAIER